MCYRFIIESPIRNLHSNSTKEKENGEKTNESEALDGEPPTKKVKENHKKDKPRGQNKGRSVPFKSLREHNICPFICDASVEEKDKECSNKNCNFIHDRMEYLKIKPEDIGTDCHLFELTGKCPRGLACRFGSKHLTTEGFNIVNNEKYEDFKKLTPSTKNIIAKDINEQLRKYKYNFAKAEKITTKHHWVKNFPI